MCRLAIPAFLALAGCATTPAVRVQTVTVDRPIAVTCVKRADLPAEPAALGTLPADARQAADLLGALDLTLRAWGHKQAALLIGCSTD